MRTAVIGNHCFSCVLHMVGVLRVTSVNRAEFFKAQLGWSRISEILHLDFLASNQHEFKPRKTRTIRLVLVDNPSHIHKETDRKVST